MFVPSIGEFVRALEWKKVIEPLRYLQSALEKGSGGLSFRIFEHVLQTSRGKYDEASS